MKQKVIDQEASADVEMRPEYDFRGATRGKAYRPLHEGYDVQVHKTDGTTMMQQAATKGRSETESRKA